MSPIASRRRAVRSLSAAACLLAALTATTDAASANPAPCERAVLTLTEAADLLRIDAHKLERLADQGKVPARRIDSSWRFNCAAIMDWLKGDVEPTAALTTKGLAQLTATGTAPDQAEAAPSTGRPVDDNQDQPIGEAPEERSAEDVFLRGQRVLLGRGEVVLDFGQFYSRSHQLELASIDDRLGLVTLEQEALVSLLVIRAGIFSETELFASTTFHRQDNHQFLGSIDLAGSKRSEFGSTRVGVRRTLLRERARRPDLVVTLDGQLPTGNTSYGLGGGLVLVKSVDPVVLFANAGYLHTFSRAGLDATRREPQKTVDVSMGYGLALNDTLAISMAVSGLFTGGGIVDQARLRRTSLYSGRIGLTSRVAQGLYIEPSVSFGLGGPVDSFAFGVSLPFAF